MIYGVDIGSRRLAVACIQPAHLDVLHLPALKTGQREDVSYALRSIGWWIQQNVPPEALVLVEKPIVMHGPKANIGTAMRMSNTVGAILTAHAGPGYIVDNAAWKVLTVGNARASKPDIARWLAEHHPALAEACGKDQDLVDASCIALAAPALVASGQL